MAEADTLLQKLLNGEGTLDFDTILSLPEGDRTVLGLDETLGEDMFEDVFEVMEFVVLELELDELSGGWLVDTGGLVVSEPKFSSSHDEDASRVRFLEEEVSRRLCAASSANDLGGLNTVAIGFGSWRL